MSKFESVATTLCGMVIRVDGSVTYSCAALIEGFSHTSKAANSLN